MAGLYGPGLGPPCSPGTEGCLPGAARDGLASLLFPSAAPRPLGPEAEGAKPQLKERVPRRASQGQGAGAFSLGF